MVDQLLEQLPLLPQTNCEAAECRRWRRSNRSYVATTLPIYPPTLHAGFVTQNSINFPRTEEANRIRGTCSFLPSLHACGASCPCFAAESPPLSSGAQRHPLSSSEFCSRHSKQLRQPRGPDNCSRIGPAGLSPAEKSQRNFSI